MRCLSLAEHFISRGDKVSFICSELPGYLHDRLKRTGIRVLGQDLSSENSGTKDIDWEIDAQVTESFLKKEQDIEWLITDHYSIDKNWETIMRPYVRKIMVIDDMANRFHDCNLLLDQNFYEEMEDRYRSLVPVKCVRLIGPRYALLRPEFRKARESLRKRDGGIRHILIFVAGGDPTNETAKVLNSIILLNRPDITCDVVAGGSNPHSAEIMRICSKLTNVNYFSQVDNMADLMVKADLAIGAGGSITWERCCLGLPTIVFTIAENQVRLTEEAARAGGLVHLGRCSEINSERITHEIENMIRNTEYMKSMSEKGLQTVDGNGVSRVEAIMRQRSY